MDKERCVCLCVCAIIKCMSVCGCVCVCVWGGGGGEFDLVSTVEKQILPLTLKSGFKPWLPRHSFKDAMLAQEKNNPYETLQVNHMMRVAVSEGCRLQKPRRKLWSWQICIFFPLLFIHYMLYSLNATSFISTEKARNQKILWMPRFWYAIIFSITLFIIVPSLWTSRFDIHAYLHLVI